MSEATKETKLKNCPFCGDHAYLRRLSANEVSRYSCYLGSDIVYRVACINCGGEGGRCRSKETTIIDWNTRATDKTIAEFVEALEKARLYIRGSNPFEKNTIEKIDAALAAVKEGINV